MHGPGAPWSPLADNQVIHVVHKYKYHNQRDFGWHHTGGPAIVPPGRKSGAVSSCTLSGCSRTTSTRLIVTPGRKSGLQVRFRPDSSREIGLPGRILAGLLPGKNRNRPSGRPYDA